MPDAEVLQGLAEREQERLIIALGASAMRSSVTLKEFIEISISQGIPREQIISILQNDLRTGGRVFGEFRRQVRATANGTINNFRDAGVFSENGVETKYRWAAVYVNTCKDCDARHRGGISNGQVFTGEPLTWEEWERKGLPRTNQTICQQNCRCMLVPEEFSTIEPVKVDKRP